MGLQVAAAGKIINEFTGLAFAGGEFETDNPAIRFVSAEAWTRDAQGAHITFATAPVGTSSPVEGMRLTSEGILLVGTDTASGSAKLQVSGAISVSGITYAGTLALAATGTNIITLSTNGSERARITSGGILGVGTNVPVGTVAQFNSTTGSGVVTTLKVSGGGTETDGTSGTRIALAFSSSLSDQYYYGYIDARRIAASFASALAFFTNNGSTGTDVTEKMRITSGGNVLVGITTDGNYKLDVASSGSSGTLRVFDQTATTGSTSLVVRAGAGQAGDIFQVVSNAGSVFMRVLVDGTIGISTKTPASAADSGTAGQVCWDASYIYVCVATNTWKRAAITTW